MDKKIDATAFEAFVSKAFNLTPEEVASLYNDAGELTDFTLLHDKQTEKVSKFSGDSKNQYSRGLKEAALKLEKELKEKYEVDSDLIGVELIDHIVDNELSKVKQSGTEDVLNHPDVKRHINSLVSQHTKERKQWLKETEEKIAAKEKEISDRELFNKVKAKALAEFRTLNPILPGDARKAAALEEVFLDALKKHTFQEKEDGFMAVDEQGVILKDKLGNEVTFAEIVKSNAERYFDFKKAEERTSAGNNNSASETTGKVRKPKDKDDFIKMMKDTTLTPKERVEINNLYQTIK